MLPAILKHDIEGFGAAKEKIWYRPVQDKTIKEKTGIEWLFEMKNSSGVTVVCEADPTLFLMYRVK